MDEPALRQATRMTGQGWNLIGTEQQARVLLEHVRDYAIFLLDREGIVRSWNDGARAIKQYEPNEILGQHFSCFYLQEDIEAGKPMRLLQLAAAQGHAEDEGWRVRKDGSRLWANVVITAVFDDRRQLVGYLKITRDRTERREAEQALGRSERDLAATLYSIGDGVISTDEQGRIERMNPVAERLTGWSQKEALGQPIDAVFKIINEHTRAPAANPVPRVIEHGLVVGLANDTVLVSRGGVEFPIADSGAPIRDESGKVRGAVLVFRDVSKERQAHQAVRESEERLRLMIASVRDYAIFMIDPSGRVASWNAGAERLKQYRAEEIVGSHFSRFYPPEEAKSGKPNRELEIAAEVGRFEEEGWRVRKDGSRFWASVVISAVRDDSGKLIGFAKVTRDMTERRRMEQELARQAVQQAAVAELGIHAVRTPGLEPVLYKALELLARTLGTEICEIFELQPDDRSLLLRAAIGWRPGSSGRVAVGAGTDSEAGFALISGEPVVVEDLATETRFPPGKLRDYGVVTGMSLMIPVPGDVRPFGVLGAHSSKRISFTPDDVRFFQSIANVIASAIGRSLAEEQIRRAETAAAEERERAMQAQETLRGRDEFLAAASHELRTPLTALQLKLQSMQAMIRRDFPPGITARGEARLQDALRQTRRLGDLVERLLDVSRIAAGRFEVDPEPLTLEALVREVVADFEEKSSTSHPYIQLSISGRTSGTWDRGRLRQVVSNLLSNALKYGEGKPIEILIQARDSDVRLTVRDQGIGIAPTDVDRIFDPFERAAPVQNFGGLGLGLYLTRHIVEAHGGAIEVISQPGAGTTFVVTLPRERAQARSSGTGGR